MRGKCKQVVESGLQKLVVEQKISAAGKAGIFTSIVFTCNINKYVAGESIIQDDGTKSKRFNNLSVIKKTETIFASSTSSLSITNFRQKATLDSNVAGMHFFMPRRC